MSEETVGKCFVCKKELTRHDISHREEGQEYQAALYFVGWPGDHVCCTKHPGITAEYEKELSHAESKKPSS